MRPLLILACSASKRDDAREIAAYDRYDGPAFRVLRASGWPNVDRGPRCGVMVLSAMHGLLNPYRAIRDYDLRMDAALADELGALPVAELRHSLFGEFVGPGSVMRQHFPASEVFVWGGRLYRQVVEEWGSRGVFEGVPGPVQYSRGRIGEQLAQLKAWLAATRPTHGGSDADE